MKIYTPTNLTSRVGMGREYWLMEYVMENGDNHGHAFPHAIIEHRAAEYGFDVSTPSARAKVFDLILHEPHMAPLDPEHAWRAGKGQSLPTDEVHLWNAPSQEHARQAHLAKLVKTKNELAQIQWPEHDNGEFHPFMEQLVSWEPNADRIAALADHHLRMRAGLGLDPAMPPRRKHPRPDPPHDPDLAMKHRTHVFLQTKLPSI